MLKSLLFTVVALVGLPQVASAVETQTLKGQVLTVLELNCAGAKPSASVEGILDDQEVDHTEVTVSPKICGEIENMIHQYDGRACARKAQFAVQETIERGIFSDSYTFELTQIEDDSPLLKNERKDDYCAQRPANFREVAPNLFVGGSPTAADFAYLKSKNIHTIVNLQGGNYLWNSVAALAIAKFQPGESPEAITNEAKLASAADIKSFNFPMMSLYVTQLDETSINLTLKVIAKAKEPVYIHCQDGVDRSGLVEAIYRAEVLKQTPLEALKAWNLVRDTRPMASYTTRRLVDYFKTRFSLPN